MVEPPSGHRIEHTATSSVSARAPRDRIAQVLFREEFRLEFSAGLKPQITAEWK
jgi:hypothetical protein